jgi:hypothetical protein
MSSNKKMFTGIALVFLALAALLGVVAWQKHQKRCAYEKAIVISYDNWRDLVFPSLPPDGGQKCLQAIRSAKDKDLILFPISPDYEIALLRMEWLVQGPQKKRTVGEGLCISLILARRKPNLPEVTKDNVGRLAYYYASQWLRERLDLIRKDPHFDISMNFAVGKGVSRLEDGTWLVRCGTTKEGLDVSVSADGSLVSVTLVSSNGSN